MELIIEVSEEKAQKIIKLLEKENVKVYKKIDNEFLRFLKSIYENKKISLISDEDALEKELRSKYGL